MKTRKKYYFSIVAIGLVAAGLLLFFGFKGEATIDYEISGKTYKLLTAKNQQEWAKGLSGIKELKGAEGMIFIFPDKRLATFWNKDTHLDLMIYWVDGEKVVGVDYLPSSLPAGRQEKSENIAEVASPRPVDKVAEIAIKKKDRIFAFNPLPDSGIASPLNVRGAARGLWFFEASFPVKLFDENDFLLAQTNAQALGDWMTDDFVPFSATLVFAVPSTGKGVLVLEKDNPSGLPEKADELKIPVVFDEIKREAREKMAAKIFLSDSKYANEPYFDCSKTVAVERQVFKTQAVAGAAIEALLRGAADEEIKEGFISTINAGVRIKSLSISNGLAKIDFDEQLEFQVGGSCRVQAIRAQIADTLKQFPTVKNVIISINGRTEDILQP